MRTSLSFFALLVGFVGCSTSDPGYIGPVGGKPDGADASVDSGTPSSTPDASVSPTVDSGTGDDTPDAGDAGVSLGPIVTKKIKDLTGTKTSSGQFGVGGTDLGIPVRQPNGKIAYIFGDTFANDTVGGDGWRAPVLLRSEPGDPKGGITFNDAAGGKTAKQILNYVHNNGQYSTWLPSDAITIGQRMYLHFIVNKGLGTVQWTQIAYSDDNGENWTLSDAKWDANDSNGLRQLWTWAQGDDGFVYVMSTSFIKRADPIIMYRVPVASILDPKAYVPWGFANGKWDWGNPATTILPGKFGELCLRRVENKWVLSWFNAGDYNISIKVFDSPTANLHTAKTYTPILGTGWGQEDDTHVAQLYGGYIHPDSTLHDLTLIVSQWNTGTNWPYRSLQFLTGVDP